MLESIIHRGVTPIGLDVGTRSIKMLQFAGAADELRALASGQYVLPGDLPAHGPDRVAALTAGINQLLDTSGFRGRRVVASLPDAMVQYKNMRLPQMPPTERTEAVKWEAADRFELDDEARVDYLDAGEVRQGDQVRDELILIAVNGRPLREHMEAMLHAGLRPVALEPAPVAIGRGLGRLVRREADQQEVRVIIDMGARATRVIVMRGRRILFYKPIDIGGEAINRAVAEHLEISEADAHELRHKLRDGEDGDPAEGEALFGSTRRENVSRAVHDSVRPIVIDLANEIGLCLRYYSVTFRGARPNGLGLVGGEAYDTLAAKIIGEQLEMATRVICPLEGVDLSHPHVALERRAHQAEWAVAAGLALRQPAAMRMRGAA